jgi:hypothetical protein
MNWSHEFLLFFDLVKFTLAQLASSPPQCHLSSDQHHHAAVSCHASFSWSQDELAASGSSSSDASSRRLLSWAKIEALNLHHHHRPPSPDHPTPTLHCYKNVISTLITFITTQLHLHFISSLTRAPCHQSFTRRYRSFSLPSHNHRPSTQRHLWWQTSRPSFTSRITYWHKNSRKKIF